MWGVRRFCSIALGMPTSDSDLNDLTWSEVLQRLLATQSQLLICHNKETLDELDVYSRILRQTNYLIGMVNREIIPLRFHLPIPSSTTYVYLPHYYLLNLQVLLFWGPKSPFATYSRLRPEYKLLGKRLELAEELSKQARIIGLIGLFFSPLVFLIQLLLFLFSNAQRLRYQPAQLFSRTWSNYARLYLRHFNELPHEFSMRLNQAYKPASEYIDCFQSRLLSAIASNLAFTLGGLSILLFVASLFREGLIQLTGYFAVMALGGLIVNVCSNFAPSEDTVHFPKFSLLATLAKINYMPDSWIANSHTHTVRDEFSQLFQFRVVGALEEILSPILTPLIMIFYVPHHCLDIVDFMRNFTVELVGVGDVCSLALFDIPRHGDPEWYPSDGATPLSPASGDDGSDGRITVRNLPAVGGKTELSLMHFHHTNPSWCLPPDSKAFLIAVQKQALNDLQRLQQGRVDVIRGVNASSALFGSLYAAHDSESVTAVSVQQKLDEVYSSDYLFHAKNVSRIPAPMEQPPFGVTSALVESVLKCNTPKTSGETLSSALPPQKSKSSTSTSLLTAPISLSLFGLTPSASLMAASGFYHNQQVLYQPFMSQTEDKAVMNTSCMSSSVMGAISYGELVIDMDLSSLYLHELHQRRRNAQRLSQTSCTPLTITASNQRQRSFTNVAVKQDELRYQQPGYRYLSSVGRGRGLVSGAPVPASLRTTRQFEGMVEEEADFDAEERRCIDVPVLQQPPASASSSSATTIVSPHALGDNVQRWPDLPPPTC